jgi:hypothetical protein
MSAYQSGLAVLTRMPSSKSGQDSSGSSALILGGIAALGVILLIKAAGRAPVPSRQSKGRDCSGWDPHAPGGWEQCDPKTVPRAARKWLKRRKR